MEVQLKVNIAMVIAVAIGEAISVLFYSDAMPWHRYRHGDRYWVAALIADFGLAFILKIVMENYWRVGRWEDAAMLALWVALLYACLEAPHAVWDHKSFSRFFVHTLHKFCIVFAMAFALFYFRNL